MGKFLLLSAVALLVVTLALPDIRRYLTRFTTKSETVRVVEGDIVLGQGRELALVTLLGFDAIPAILDPDFATAREAESWMDSEEQVLGLSIDGEYHAYPIRMLSRHETVNDVVGEVPVAVTW